MVAQHISHGVYGLILVEPEGGLPKADREFYVMQGELYTKQRHGEKGLHEFSVENLLAENPQHLMFNGTMDALTKTYKMEANTGDNVLHLLWCRRPQPQLQFSRHRGGVR